MNQEIVAGDIVTLKSGGPVMTVGEIVAGVANCYWFAVPFNTIMDDMPAFGCAPIAVVALQTALE